MTIYTKHSIHSAATEMARIYENSSQKNQIIIGLDAQGNVEYGFKNVTPIPLFITKDQYSVLEDWDIVFKDADEWTDEERENAIEAFEFGLCEPDDIVFGCEDECVDINEDIDMETYVIARDNDTNLRFTGELLANESSSPDKQDNKSSGETGRWSELRLYRTQSGKYICEQVGRTQWQGERDRCKAAVAETQEKVIEFFGTGWLAKKLYAQAAIECILDVD